MEQFQRRHVDRLVRGACSKLPRFGTRSNQRMLQKLGIQFFPTHPVGEILTGRHWCSPRIVPKPTDAVRERQTVFFTRSFDRASYSAITASRYSTFNCDFPNARSNSAFSCSRSASASCSRRPSRSSPLCLGPGSSRVHVPTVESSNSPQHRTTDTLL